MLKIKKIKSKNNSICMFALAVIDQPNTFYNFDLNLKEHLNFRNGNGQLDLSLDHIKLARRSAEGFLNTHLDNSKYEVVILRVTRLAAAGRLICTYKMPESWQEHFSKVD